MKTLILDCTDLDDALRLCRQVTLSGVRAVVPMPNGTAWRFVRTKWSTESWPAGVESRDLPCVCLDER